MRAGATSGRLPLNTPISNGTTACRALQSNKEVECVKLVCSAVAHRDMKTSVWNKRFATAAALASVAIEWGPRSHTATRRLGCEEKRFATAAAPVSVANVFASRSYASTCNDTEQAVGYRCMHCALKRYKRLSTATTYASDMHAPASNMML